MTLSKAHESKMIKIALIIIAVMVVVIVSSLYITTLPNYDKASMEPILSSIGLPALMVIIGLLFFLMAILQRKMRQMD